ncbi:MAG: hypothetical protein QM736_28800 [Vicinamibacterales bacterium]
MTATQHPRIWVARQAPFDGDRVATAVRALRRAVTRADSAASLDILASAVPGFSPTDDAVAFARTQAIAPDAPFVVQPLARAV